MKIEIVCGTNRPNSNSMKVCQIVHEQLEKNQASPSILDLQEVPLQELNGTQYSENKPQRLTSLIERINSADGVFMVVPEYNGSFPGALKYFIDHWDYPKTFESRPVAFIGLGGRFGGLRPVEHLQQVFGYRNSYIFPERLFLTNVWSLLKDGKIEDDMISVLLEKQCRNFIKFIKALKTEQLDSNSL